MKKDYIATYAHRFGDKVNYLISVSYREAKALGYKLIYLKSNRVINKNQVSKLNVSASKNSKRFVHDALVILADGLKVSIGDEEFDKLEFIYGDRTALSTTEDLSKCLIVIDGQHRIQACIDNEELNIDLLLADIPEGMSVNSFIRLYNSCSNRWSRKDYICSHYQTGELTNKVYSFSIVIASETDYSDKAAEYLCTGSREGAKLQDLIENNIGYVMYSEEKCKAALIIAEIVRFLNSEDLLKTLPRIKKNDSDETRKEITEKRDDLKKVMKVRRYFYTIDFIDVLCKTHTVGGTEIEWAQTVASFLLSLKNEDALKIYDSIIKKNSGAAGKTFLKLFNAFLSDTTARENAKTKYSEADIKKIELPIS